MHGREHCLPYPGVRLSRVAGAGHRPDSNTCGAVATALGSDFAPVATGMLEPTSAAALTCGLSFVQPDVTIAVDIYDFDRSLDSQALCQSFQTAGFALDPPQQWRGLCGSTLPSRAQAIAVLLTCP
jgi:hypothetical protein